MVAVVEHLRWRFVQDSTSGILLGISYALVSPRSFFVCLFLGAFSWQQCGDVFLRSLVIVKIEISVILVGFTMMSLSFCGCVGALRENTCLLNTYSYFITALLLMNLILGLLFFFLPAQFKRVLRSTLTKNLVIHYRDSADLQGLIDSIQVNFWLRVYVCKELILVRYFQCSRVKMRL